LISLGILDSGGYKYVGQGGALKVLKGSLVVMKETRVDNLYKMEGSTKVAYEVTDVSSCLWKKQHNHMSKKELQNCKFLSDLGSLFMIFFLFYIYVSYDDGKKGCNVCTRSSLKKI
jgi:hypothetical protein